MLFDATFNILYTPYKFRRTESNNLVNKGKLPEQLSNK